MTRAANVGPGGLGDNPQHSWAVGTAPGDGVDSLLERFRALGADPLVADEAISGATMRMAPAMARRILTAAGGAPAPGPAAVTILMGANDACARTVNGMTSLESFERDLAGTLAILRDGATVEGGRTLPGLPTGSTLIVLAVPDVARLRDMAAPSGLAEAARGLFCPNLLAPDAPPDQVEAARARIQAFNAALAQACEEVEVRDGRTGRLHCRHDGGLLFTTLIGADDISSLDGFHPSLAGQAKLADLAWLTGPWSATRPIPGGATPAPGSGDSLPPPTRRASPRRSGAPAPGP
jgi:lysophospholipase L1-like esterase